MVIVSEEDKALRPYLDTQFLPQHREYPHPIEYFTVKDLSNNFAAVRQLLTVCKDQYEGYLLLHGDTVVGVPLSELVQSH